MRIELQNSGVTFYEDEHRYFLGEKELFGITPVLQETLTPGSLDNIPEPILARATERGKRTHASLEAFITDWTNDGSNEVRNFIKLIHENHIFPEAAEYLVTDFEHYASSVDLVARVDDSTFDLYDYKSYSTLDAGRLMKAKFQLSIYAYMFELLNPKAAIRNLGIIRLRDELAEIVPVERVPESTCRELLECYRLGKPEDFLNPYGIPLDVAAQEKRIRELMAQKTTVEEELSAIKENLFNRMVEANAKQWSTLTMKLTIKSGTPRTSLDTAKLKKAYPDLHYEDFMKTTQVKDSLLITL